MIKVETPRADAHPRLYWHNKREVVCDYDDGGVVKGYYIYGNYIDEVVASWSAVGYLEFRVHDHLYSTVALTSLAGALRERYEYDAYGNSYILEPNFAPDPDGNPYLFTGRRVDFLDDGSLTLQYNRHRYYEYYTGRWTTQDPLGVTVKGGGGRRPPTTGVGADR